MRHEFDQRNKAVAKVHGRVALVGEYLDGIFSDRAVTCGVADAWYELVVTTSKLNHDPHEAIDNRRLVPTILDTVRSRLPSLPKCEVLIVRAMRSGAGLGSSAAFSVGVVAAAAAIQRAELDRTEIAQLAIEAEKQFGITGGRMDQYSAAFGGMNAFRFGDSGATEVVSLTMPSEAMLVIADSGVRRRSGEIIDGVVERARVGAIDVDGFVRDGNRIADAIVALLSSGEADLTKLGQLVAESQAGLRDVLQVSSPMLDGLINAAHYAGAYGAKISGAGLGGCIFALCDQQSVGAVAETLQREGAEVLVTAVGRSGVKIHENDVETER